MNLKEYIKEVGVATDFSSFKGEESIYVTMKPEDLFLAQYHNNDFNAVDVVVKYLAIENFYGKNNFGLKLYHKLQQKRINEDWDERFVNLMRSFEENGIDMNSWIQVDLDYSIHDGAHRLALALYHGLEYVPVNVFNVYEQRRFYGMKWLEENGFSEKEIAVINEKLEELLEKCRKSYYCILWPPARYQYHNIEKDIDDGIEDGVQILETFEMQLRRDELKKFVYNVYETDDITKYKLDLKYEHIMKSMDVDGFNEELYPVYIVKLKIDNPDFRLKPLSGLPQSKTTMRIKKQIRDRYKEKVTDYYHDIIMHLTDNQLQNNAVEQIIKRFEHEQWT